MPGKISWSPWEPPAPQDPKPEDKKPEDRKWANEFLMGLCCRYLENQAGDGLENDDVLGTLDDVVRFLKESPNAKGEGGGDAS